MHKRTVAYLTGTRADFGLMTPVLQALQKRNLTLQLLATGMHLLPEFGRTIREVRHQYPAVRVIRAVMKHDDERGLSTFFGRLVTLLVQELQRQRPDIFLVLGDRAEMLAAATACLYLQIPVGHIHGGDVTTTLDDTARHAITKLSHLHFPATEQSARRIRALGEEPWRIFRVGAPGLDAIRSLRLSTRRAFLKKYGLPNGPFLLVTQHPTSETWRESRSQIRETLAAVRAVKLPALIVYPNADAGGRAMIREIRAFRASTTVCVVPHIPYPDFLTAEREAAAWIGNSSAGIIEASAFHTPVINVGSRQHGRERGPHVLDVPHDRQAIHAAIRRALQPSFRRNLARKSNPWGDGHAGRKIASILARIPLDSRLIHKYFDYEK